jgi:hypothetical protein
VIVVDLPPRTRLVPADEPGPAMIDVDGSEAVPVTAVLADGLMVRLAGEEWIVRSDLGLVVEWEEP